MSELDSVFRRIADINHWGNEESLSGDGSTLDYTANLRRELAKFVRAFEIKAIFDAPCGDFNWMRAVDFPVGLDYLGGDIVPSLVEANRAKYEAPRRRFRVFDIVSDPFPDADLLFCRDCLFHLPIAAIMAILRHYSASRISYLMTTTHLNATNFENRDIEAGDFRLLDLYAAPFGLPRNVLYRIPDYVFPYPQRELCVWSRAQVASAIGDGG